MIYWPLIDKYIEHLRRTCNACAEHQNKPPKPAIICGLWMLPEKPRSQVHVDHAINFKVTNWLVMLILTSSIPAYVNHIQSYKQTPGSRFCSFWLASQHSDGQCYYISLRRVPSLVQGEGNYPSNGSTQSSGN